MCAFYTCKYRFFLFFVSLGGIAPKPRPISADRYAINVTDSADIFTEGSPNEVRKKLKISPHPQDSSGDIDATSMKG